MNLISGGWNVTAAQDIYLQEVRNPNGDFNTVEGSGSPTGAYHTFDYAPSDYVNLTAGNLVRLGAPSSALPRLNGLDSLRVPVIYPGILDVSAGAGGVVLDGDNTYNQLILYPSPLGSLVIDTTDGGSLVGQLPTVSGAPQVFNLIVSDSGNDQYDSSTEGLFGLNDHASTPVHADSEMPVDLEHLRQHGPRASGLTGSRANQCGGQYVQLPVSRHEFERLGRDHHHGGRSRAKVNMEKQRHIESSHGRQPDRRRRQEDRSAFTSVVLASAGQDSGLVRTGRRLWQHHQCGSHYGGNVIIELLFYSGNRDWRRGDV